MDEAITLISRGCKLAKDLESDLPNQPQPTHTSLSKSCDEIIWTFTAAKQRLTAADPSRLYPPQTLSRDPTPMDPTSLQEWHRTNMRSTTITMDHHHQLLQMQLMAAKSSSEILMESNKLGGGGRELEMESGGLVVEFGGRDVQVNTDASHKPARRASSSSQIPRRRKNDAEKRTIRVSAPQMGNTEIPPEDGFTWRKYGQKEILGAKFPRSYYRCTHQKLYNCQAKKQVQRLDDDPFTFEITYRSDHTCHMTATAPSVRPPQMTREMASQLQIPPSSGSHLGRLLEISLGGGGAGPSTVRSYTKELPDYPITDMADAMFNSGSSSSNSMEFIFPQNMDQEKWDPLQGEKKDQ